MKKYFIIWVGMAMLLGIQMAGTVQTSAAGGSYYEWTFNAGDHSISGDMFYSKDRSNNAVLMDGAAAQFKDGEIILASNTYYELKTPVQLNQNKRWRVEWCGKIRAATRYGCTTILANSNRLDVDEAKNEQYIMCSRDAVFFGNNSNARVTMPCPSNVLLSKTRYILEGDADRHVRLRYAVEGGSWTVGEWMDYPEAVGDLTLGTVFGNYKGIYYDGTMDYLKVWEDYVAPYTYIVENGKATITGCVAAPESEVEIPAEIDGIVVDAIGQNAFAQQDKIKTVIIPETVTAIETHAFAGCAQLDEVRIPASVKRIEPDAFEGSVRARLLVYRGSYAHQFVQSSGISYSVINEDNQGIISNLLLKDENGRTVYGTDSDAGCKAYYVTGTVQNHAKAQTHNLCVALASYNQDGVLKDADIRDFNVPPNGELSISSQENTVKLDGGQVSKGDYMKIFLLEKETLSPFTLGQTVYFDGKRQPVIQMLSIGNSFSIDASTRVHDIAAADGAEINIMNMHIGGCTLKMHWENALTGAGAYKTQVNGISSGSNVSLPAALEKETWDYISFQQGSHESNQFSNFWTPEHPYLTNLADYVRERVPDAVQLIHQTWPYQNQNAISRLGYSGAAPLARNAMFQDVKDAYAQASSMLDADQFPCGEAVQRAMNVYGFTEEQIYRDGSSHLTMDIGYYLVGAVWYECLTGNSILHNSYVPDGVSQIQLAKLKAAAHEAVAMDEYRWTHRR